MVSVCSYAIPVFGFVYWYSRVPYYLWKLNSVNSTSVKRSVAKVIRRVIIIVVVFSMVYLVCWTPYWLGLYAHYFFDQIPMTKNSANST
jgi:hypothetical protein